METEIFLWLQQGVIYKAVINETEGTIHIYNHNDELILRRLGLTRLQIRVIKSQIIKYGLKRIENKNHYYFRGW